MPFSIEGADLITIGLLVLLEAALSADNALVLAVLVLPLPKRQQKKALQYGIVGAFAFRILATVFAVQLIHLDWIKLIGGLYLLYLPIKHFSHRESEGGAHPLAKTLLGLSFFWTTVVRVEGTDIVFAIDSILVAVGMSRKLWVVLTGGLLGIVAMRLLIGQMLSLVGRYPAIVDGAYVIVAWVGVKLTLEFLHAIHVIGFEIPHAIGIGIVLVLFMLSTIYAVFIKKPAKEPPPPAVDPFLDIPQPPPVRSKRRGAEKG
jgi:YkoY family integral membrane protein